MAWTPLLIPLFVAFVFFTATFSAIAQEDGATITLPPGSVTNGILNDGPSGKPVPNQPITVWSVSGKQFGHLVRTVVTDSNGKFQIIGLQNSTYLFSAFSKGGGWFNWPLYPPSGAGGLFPHFKLPMAATLVLQNSKLKTQATPITAKATPQPAGSAAPNAHLFFVTDRAIRSGKPLGFADLPKSDCHDPMKCFTYGSIDPSTGVPGTLPTPAGNPSPTPYDQLVEGLRQAVIAIPGSPREIVIFIEGCCTDFTGAVDDGRVIVNGLNRRGYAAVPPLTNLPVIVYSYPTRPGLQLSEVLQGPVHYPSDETETVWSYPHLTALIHALLTNGNIDKIDLIAHSLGNRVLFPALELLATEYPKDRSPRIGTVLFLAPDIDLQTFQEAAGPMFTIATNVEIYRSDLDEVIDASRVLHQHSRLGYIEYPDKPSVGSITVLDASTFFCPQNGQYVSGHFYWKASPIVFEDIRQALLGVMPGAPGRDKYLKHDGNQWLFDVGDKVPDGGCSPSYRASLPPWFIPLPIALPIKKAH